MPVKNGPRSYRSPARAAASDETRARIVAAARTLLAGGEGLPPFSLDGAARQAGVTRLTVYNQFESRRGLLEAVFDAVAQEGGLTVLPSVLAEPDVEVAMRRFVAVFCRFWSNHGTVMLHLSAVVRLDQEVHASLLQRTERRRQLLTVLVQRLLPDAPRPDLELIDVLFALTGFEMYEQLCARNRGAAAVEELVQDLVAQTIRRYRGGR